MMLAMSLDAWGVLILGVALLVVFVTQFRRALMYFVDMFSGHLKESNRVIQQLSDSIREANNSHTQIYHGNVQVSEGDQHNANATSGEINQAGEQISENGKK